MLTMSQLQFIYNRVSIRSFKDDVIPNADIEEIIKAATYAPSGKNQQNWHFVVVKNREIIAGIVKAVQEKNAELAEFIPESKQKAFRGMVNYHTVFKGAPVLVLAYAGPYPTVADDLTEAGIMKSEDIAFFRQANPGIQAVAAAMENLLLSAAALGYGTCWMTGPTYAAAEISRLVGFDKPGYYLAAMSPLGVPAEGKYANPPRKSIAEVLTILD